MRTHKTLSALLAFAVVSVGSLGATDCGEGALQGLFTTVAGHEQRIDALERCDCEGLLAPVCGENGRTYVNLCEARCAGTEIAFAGPCRKPECGGPNAVTCASGEFCETFPGCDAQAGGFCEDIPQACTREYVPVCGCDGKTYANDCERRAAGVPLAFERACDDQPAICHANDACDATDYCHKPEGTCSDGAGACTPRPEVCTLDYDPVCGCDGKTYSNACAAAISGVSIDHDGVCATEPVACGDNTGCATGEFCKKRVGECDSQGICVLRPQVCPLDVAQVCGCDGRTYDNECNASAAGASLASSEACKEAKVTLCHVPPGNPGNRHTITVDASAVPAHLKHGDSLGPCPH